MPQPSQPPGARSGVVYIAARRRRQKSAAFCKIEIAPGGDWHIVPLAGLCATYVQAARVPAASAQVK